MHKTPIREQNSTGVRKRNAIFVGSLAAVGIALAFGILTVLIPNTFFTRMTLTHWYDYIFLLLTAVLGGASLGLWYYRKGIEQRCMVTNASGMVGGIFSFGCAICNKLLLLLFGVSGVLAYFMPIQPYLGVVSVGLLSAGVYWQYRNLKPKRIIKHRAEG